MCFKGHHQVKRWTTEWKKIILNDTSDKKHISKLHKEHLKLNNKKVNNTICYMGKGSEYTVLQRRYTKG